MQQGADEAECRAVVVCFSKRFSTMIVCGLGAEGCTACLSQMGDGTWMPWRASGPSTS